MRQVIGPIVFKADKMFYNRVVVYKLRENIKIEYIKI